MHGQFHRLAWDREKGLRAPLKAGFRVRARHPIRRCTPRSAASTTTTPRDSLVMMRLRRGEILSLGTVAKRGFGDDQALCADLGIEALGLRRVDMIETAKVPVAKVAAWPSPSMSSARPDTMTNPAAPKSAEMSRVSLRPAANALRAPTMATVGRAARFVLSRRGSAGEAALEGRKVCFATGDDARHTCPLRRSRPPPRQWWARCWGCPRPAPRACRSG